MKKILVTLLLSVLMAVGASAKCTVHLFLVNDWFLESLPISVNGEKAFEMKGDPIKKTMTGDMYRRSYTKCTFPEEDNVVLSYDMTWAGVPYHEDISLSLDEENDIYLKLYMPGLSEALRKGRNCFQFKIMNEKEIKKELKNLSKGKYTVNPDYEMAE